jgi:hypothetical protein
VVIVVGCFIARDYSTLLHDRAISAADPAGRHAADPVGRLGCVKDFGQFLGLLIKQPVLLAGGR